MPENYWFTLNRGVKKTDDDNIALTFKDENGDPLDVSGWANKTYRATGTHTTDEINIANAAMTVTSSGTGVNDTIIIPFSASDTDVEVGRYEHDFRCEIASDDRTIFDGTLYVSETKAVVP